MQHITTINGEQVRWQMIGRGHWRWNEFDLIREVDGRPSVGLMVDWSPGGYRDKSITWWIYENGKRGPKPLRSLSHAQRAVRGRVESRKAER
jgi:hypothetical protein